MGGSEPATHEFDFTIADKAITNNIPVIHRLPNTNATVGVGYRFQPTAGDSDGDSLVFSIRNMPRWTSFDRLTGRLGGTPGSNDAGDYRDFVISVSDGQTSAGLPAFSITVDPVSAGTAALSWNPPTELVDNTVPTDFSGYEI